MVTVVIRLKKDRAVVKLNSGKQSIDRWTRDTTREASVEMPPGARWWCVPLIQHFGGRGRAISEFEDGLVCRGSFQDG